MDKASFIFTMGTFIKENSKRIKFKVMETTYEPNNIVIKANLIITLFMEKELLLLAME